MVAGRAVIRIHSSISRESGSGSKILMAKIEEKNTAEIFNIFFGSKLQFTYVQATGEAFTPQKRTSCTSEREIYYFISMFVGHLCPPGSGSRDPIEYGSNPDPDPQLVWNMMSRRWPRPASLER
jgi:hypothetical protein